ATAFGDGANVNHRVTLGVKRTSGAASGRRRADLLVVTDQGVVEQDRRGTADVVRRVGRELRRAVRRNVNRDVALGDRAVVKADRAGAAHAARVVARAGGQRALDRRDQIHRELARKADARGADVVTTGKNEVRVRGVVERRHDAGARNGGDARAVRGS